MDFPEHLRYSTDHEWVVVADGVARIGITDYAQDALGDVVYVGVPSIGAVVVAGASMGEVESTKSVSDLYAPVSGTVVAVNDALGSSPEVLNTDPYGAGWICDIQMTESSQYDALLDVAGYRALVGG